MSRATGSRAFPAAHRRRSRRAVGRAARARCAPPCPAGMDGNGAVGAFLSGGLDSSTVAGLMAERLRPAPGRSLLHRLRLPRATTRWSTRASRPPFRPRGSRALPDARGRAGRDAATCCAAATSPSATPRSRPRYQCARARAQGGHHAHARGRRRRRALRRQRALREAAAVRALSALPAPLRRGLIEPLIGPLGRDAAGLGAGQGGTLHRAGERRRCPTACRATTTCIGMPVGGLRAAFLESRRRDAAAAALASRSTRRPSTATPWIGCCSSTGPSRSHDNDLRQGQHGVPRRRHGGRLPDARPRARRPELQVARLAQAARRASCAGSTSTPRASCCRPRLSQRRSTASGCPSACGRARIRVCAACPSGAGSLAGRGIFRREFLRETLRLHREGHAAYYGELVWVLMALEIWLDANPRRLAA